MPRLTVRPIASEQDRADAVTIWADALRALHRAPGDERRERVAAEIAAAPVPLLAMYGDLPAGMAVAEPYRDALPGEPKRGHVSMLFVSPARWGNGIGSALVRALQEPPRGTGWTGLSAWTRATNRRAQRLYLARGFTDTGERAHLHEGAEIRRFSWSAG